MKTEQKQLKIDVRIAGAGDAPSIASVLHESFLEYRSLYTPEGFSATTLTSSEIEDRLHLDEGPTWVALCEDLIVGTVSAVVKGESIFIRSMAILPTARGQGIGELLLTQIESFALERGCARLFLNTTPFLSRAIRLYERFGFCRNGEDPHDLFGTPLFTMVKTLV
ncbi:MAG TPA: GNAT family N-acetyltransferase [Blastocatellia bacterium]|nr:GNAT family N-acetyltransferase [Blastocatellia bacterium]